MCKQEGEFASVVCSAKFNCIDFWLIFRCKVSPAEQSWLSLSQGLCHSRNLQGAAAELWSWQVSPSGERIKLPLVSWSLVIMVLMSGAWVGSGSCSGGFKAPQDYRRSCLMMVPVLQGNGNWSILARTSSTSCRMPIG